MEGQREVYGDAPAFHAGIHPGTAGDFLHPFSAAGEVLGVVVVPVVEGIHLYAVPLHLVQGAFHIRGHAGQAAAARHLAHAAAKAHRIGRYYPAAAAPAAQTHITLLSLVEGEGAQVHPGAAAHGLVHVQEAFSAQVMDGITGVRSAAGKGFIGDINGVVSFFRDVGPPDDLCVGAVSGGGPGLARGAHPEGILIHLVLGAEVGKTVSGIFPMPFFLVIPFAAQQAGPGVFKGRVVVADHFIGLRIPFPRRNHHCAGILQHRQQEGDHKALGIKVFHRAVGGRPLPFPAVRLGFPVAAVALPQGDMAALEALGPVVVSLDQRNGLIPRVFHFEGGLGGASVPGEPGHGQGGQVLPFGIEGAQRIASQSFFPQCLQLFPHPGQVFLSPGIIGELLREIEIQYVSPYGHLLQFEGRVHAGTALEPLLQRIRGLAEGPGRGTLLRLGR